MSTPNRAGRSAFRNPSPSNGKRDRLAERTSGFAAALYDEIATAYLNSGAHITMMHSRVWPPHRMRARRFPRPRWRFWLRIRSKCFQMR